MKALLLTTSIAVILATSCTGTVTQDDPPPPGSGTLPPAGPGSSTPEAVTDRASFTEALQAAGFDARDGERTTLPGLPAGQEVIIDDVAVSVVEYATETAGDGARSSVSADGSEAGGADVHWAGPPHFYGSGRLVVLYVGDKARTLDALELVLGPQFAGR